MRSTSDGLDSPPWLALSACSDDGAGSECLAGPREGWQAAIAKRWDSSLGLFAWFRYEKRLLAFCATRTDGESC